MVVFTFLIRYQQVHDVVSTVGRVEVMIRRCSGTTHWLFGYNCVLCSALQHGLAGCHDAYVQFLDQLENGHRDILVNLDHTWMGLGFDVKCVDYHLWLLPLYKENHSGRFALVCSPKVPDPRIPNNIISPSSPELTCLVVSLKDMCRPRTFLGQQETFDNVEFSVVVNLSK
jgi:hypothetical protein